MPSNVHPHTAEDELARVVDLGSVDHDVRVRSKVLLRLAPSDLSTKPASTADRRYWRFSLDEIRELARGVWPGVG